MQIGRHRRWLAPLMIGVISAAIYCINLERLPHNDELYHLLAAEGLLRTGEPAIGENGRYWRGYPTTWLVARSIDLFGANLTAARLPSVAAMAALAACLFIFLRREASATAAWIGAGLFALSPFAIEIAQLVRFYSLQCLAFFLGAWCLYELVKGIGARSPATLVALGGAAAVSIPFAAYLQETTLLGVAGLALWGGGVALLAFWCAAGRTTGQRLAMSCALGALGALVLAALLASGMLLELWAALRSTPLFNRGTANHFWWYHVWYILFYPTLWSLVGIITILALIAAPRAGWFLLAVFATGFLLNSLAGPKNLRYLAYAQPFLFGLWGIGLAHALDAGGRRLVDRALAALRDRLTAVPPGWARPLARSLVTAALLLVVLVNPAWLRSVTLIADIAVPPERPTTDWPAAKPALQQWLDNAEVVVVAEELNPLYFYGRADIVLSASRHYEIPADRRHPFAPDHRTDVPSIADAASLERVIDCYRTGLFLIEAQFWGPGATQQRDAEVEALLLARAEPFALPPETQLLAFVWRTDPDTIDDTACRSLPDFTPSPAT